MKKIFVVTSEWISSNKTAAGGYTARQLQILEVPWPPTKGWVGRVVGRKITLSEKRAFEAERGPRPENQTRTTRIEAWRKQKRESGKITSQFSESAISKVLSGLE